MDAQPSIGGAKSGRCRQCGRDLSADSYIQTRLGSFCGMPCAEKAELTDTRFAGSVHAPAPPRRSILLAPFRWALIVFLILIIAYSYMVLFRGMAGPMEMVKALRSQAGEMKP